MSPAALAVARLGTELPIVFLLCRRPNTLRLSDRPTALDPSHDPRSPENHEAAPQLVKWSVDATCIRHDL
jgi:hypothetical protein